MTQTFGETGTIPEWTVGDRLRKAREMTGLDQRQFAMHTGLSRGTVNNYEGGKVEPRRPSLILWAMATGVPVTWIETGCTPRDLNPEPTD